jgi:hypothetical protein
MSRDALRPAPVGVGVGKGKSRASPDYHVHGNTTEYELQESTYPPRANRSPGTSYTPSNSTHTLAYPSNSKPLPALPPTSPTRTIFGRSLGSQSTLVPSSSSGSSSPTTRVGYELCAVCFEKVGLDHALPGGLDSPSSPTLPPTPQELAIARRSAPKRKGELRHAFLFQIWGFNGWQVIGAFLSRYTYDVVVKLNIRNVEQSKTKYRIIAPAVIRYCREIGINVPFARTSRFVERATSAYPHSFGSGFLM